MNSDRRNLPHPKDGGVPAGIGFGVWRSGRPSGCHGWYAGGPGASAVGGSVDGAGDGGWQRDQDDFVAFAVHAQDAVTVFFPKSLMLAPVACRWMSPKVGDSWGTGGRRT
jgi:hypothetical protein